VRGALAAASEEENEAAGVGDASATVGHFQRPNIWWRGEEADVASRDPRVGKENREAAGANCGLGMKIVLLHPNNFV
jgi:hypothetical protein